MNPPRGHRLFWTILVIGAAADLLSKWAAFRFLETSPASTHVVWYNLLVLSAQSNTGGPFSILTGHPWLLAVVAAMALGVILWLYLVAAARDQFGMVAALALVAAGALGNLADRVLFGAVRDFIKLDFLRWGSWHYPVFNVADILICAGAVLMTIVLMRDGRHQQSNPDPTQ